jgi:Tfp pilus assembly protein PilN
MTDYHPNTPRTALGLVATAMAALTLSVLVVLPSKMEPDSRAYAMLATQHASCAEASALKCVQGCPVEG